MNERNKIGTKRRVFLLLLFSLRPRQAVFKNKSYQLAIRSSQFASRKHAGLPKLERLKLLRQETRLNWLIFGKKKPKIESLTLFGTDIALFSKYGQRAQHGSSKGFCLQAPAFGGLSAPNKRPICVPLRIGPKGRCPA